MNNIIENKITLLGDFDTIQEILKRIKSNESEVDFYKIKPMDKDLNDLVLDDYMNLCLNAYIQKNPENKEELINTFRFVGKTREKPYEFKVLSDVELNSAKSKYQTKKLLADAKFFIERIKDKSIFNGYMIRDAYWGTGSGAVNARVRDNRIEFITYDKAPIKLFTDISKIYPNIKINYCYHINGNTIDLCIKDGNIDTKDNYEEPTLFSLITKNVKI